MSRLDTLFGRLGEVLGKPVASQVGHLLQGAGFLEEVRCSGDYRQVRLGGDLCAVVSLS